MTNVSRNLLNMNTSTNMDSTDVAAIDYAAGCSLTKHEREAFEVLLNLYECHQRGTGGKAPKTILNNRYIIMRALKFIDKPPWEWRPNDIDAHLTNQFVEFENGESTQCHRISALRKFQNYLLADTGLCNKLLNDFGCRPEPFITETNAIPYKSKSNERKKIITPLTSEQCQQLIAEFDFDIYTAHKAGSKSFNTLRRDKVITLVALMTGLRAAELSDIEITDFKPDLSYPQYGAYSLLNVIGKGRKTRCVRLYNPAIRGILDWYMKSVRPNFLTKHTREPSLLFLSERGGRLCERQYRRMLKKIGSQAGLPMRVKPHLLRHTYATQMVNIIGPEALQKQLGHKYLSTTLGIYYHQNPENVGREVLLGIEKMTAQLDALTEPYINESYS